jgi:hypothetical protein
MFNVAIALHRESRSPNVVIRSVGELLAPNKPARIQYEPIYRKLLKFVPEEYRVKVTPRRVRAIYNDEAKRVEWYEMQALLRIEEIEEARVERQKLKARSHRLATLIAADAETLDSEERRELGRLAGALDRAGIRPIAA